MATTLRKKIANPLKATSLAAVLYYTYWMYNARKDAFADAMNLVATYHETVMGSIESKIPEITEGLSYDGILQEILLALNDVDTSSVPNLLTTFTDDILENMKNKIDSTVETIMNAYRLKGDSVKVEADVKIYVDQIMETLDSKFQQAIETIGSEDVEELVTFYDEMIKTMRPRFVKEITKIVTDNVQARVKRAYEFYESTRDSLLDTYRRFIDTAKSIRGDFISTNQARNLVKADIETRIVTVFIRFIKYDMFEEYASGSEDVDDDALKSFVETHFTVAEPIRTGAIEEIEFRVGFGHVPNLITSRASQVYLNRYDTIHSDKLLTSVQKRSLNKFTKQSYDSLIEELETTENTELYTLEAMKGYAEEYFDEVLPDMRNYVLAIFIEFRSVLKRARLEGQQTCILQFYEMRRALDYNFFFAMSEEEDFDIDRTLSRFNTFFDESLSSGREKMISLARMPYVLFLFSDSFDFLSSLSEVLFFTEMKIYNAVSELTSDFHDKLAVSVGEFMDLGIEDVYAREEEESRDVVMTVFEDFRNNMEVQKVRHIVDEVRVIMANEIATNVSFVSNILPDLVLSFKDEATSPFDEEWMLETQKLFITEEDADFDGMKRYVVEEMNKIASSVTQKYIDTVGEYIDNQIVTIGSSLGSIVESVSGAVRDSPIGEDEKQSIYDSLQSTQDDINGTISSVDTSIRVAIDTFLQEAIRSLDQLMDTITENFFNSTLQVVITGFEEWAGSSLQEMYANRMDDISVEQKQLANKAREIFEDHVTKLVDVENEYRSLLEIDNVVILEKWSLEILEEYNIVSYNARRGILLNDMKNEIATVGLSLRRQRSDKIWDLKMKYEEEQRKFQNTYNQLATAKKIQFSNAYSSLITSAYEKYSDVLGTIGGVLKVLEGPMRSQYSDMYNEVVDAVLASPFNDLPERDMFSVCYSPGLLGVADPFEGNLPSLMIPHLMINDELSLAGDEFYDGDVVDAVTEETLETVGASDELKPHERIILALSNFDDWEKNAIDVAISDLEASMDQRLKENTCQQKPCKDGTSTCESPSCRDGYIMEENSHGILCCKWDPPAAGFPVGDVAVMIGVEMALMFFTSPGGLRSTAKLAKWIAKGVLGDVKAMGKAIGVALKFKKLSGPIGKAGAKLSKKMALKIGYKSGRKVGTKLAAKLGLKLGLKIGVKVGTQIGKTVINSAMKVAMSGPVGAVLFVFDMVSLILDLWDPVGYNNAQAAGTIRELSDNITKQFTEMLKDEGINAPMLANVMYEIEPERQGEFVENLVMEWFSDSIGKFVTSNQPRWEIMPSSTAGLEYEAEINRLSAILDSDINFIQQLICNNLENTIMVKSSTVNGTDPNVVGTKDDKDYDTTTNTHLMLCSLTDSGVQLANSFSVQKTDFVNEMRADPIYRWSRIVNGFKVYSSMTDSEYSDVEREINRRESLGVDITDEELNTPAAFKIGFDLEKVDPETEFWKQYVFMKESVSVNSLGAFEIISSGKLPERKDYMKAWEADHARKQELYEKTIEATMEEMIEDMIPCDPVTGFCEGNASIEMIKNKTSESPSWYPEYNDLYEDAKRDVDENIEDVLEEERVNKILEIELEKLMKNKADELVVEETKHLIHDDLGYGSGGENEYSAEHTIYHEEDMHPITLEEARGNRIAAERAAARQVISPDFAVFKNGYGQTSPLFSIKSTCDDMGYGVKFNQVKGSCDFTKEYCKKYGLTYFYNQKLGEDDCKLAGTQRVFETVIGTTITRGMKKWFTGTQGPTVLGSSGNSSFYSLSGSMGSSMISPYEATVELDKLGLGAPYSIWN